MNSWGKNLTTHPHLFGAVTDRWIASYNIYFPGDQKLRRKTLRRIHLLGSNKQFQIQIKLSVRRLPKSKDWESKLIIMGLKQPPLQFKLTCFMQVKNQLPWVDLMIQPLISAILVLKKETKNVNSSQLGETSTNSSVFKSFVLTY